MTPQKPRIRILRTEPHRTIAGRTDTIWNIDFGSPPNRRAVEAWMRCNPNFGEPTSPFIDQRRTVA